MANKQWHYGQKEKQALRDELARASIDAATALLLNADRAQREDPGLKVILPGGEDVAGLLFNGRCTAQSLVANVAYAIADAMLAEGRKAEAQDAV